MVPYLIPYRLLEYQVPYPGSTMYRMYRYVYDTIYVPLLLYSLYQVIHRMRLTPSTLVQNSTLISPFSNARRSFPQLFDLSSCFHATVTSLAALRRILPALTPLVHEEASLQIHDPIWELPLYGSGRDIENKSRHPRLRICVTCLVIKDMATQHEETRQCHGVPHGIRFICCSSRSQQRCL